MFAVHNDHIGGELVPAHNTSQFFLCPLSLPSFLSPPSLVPPPICKRCCCISSGNMQVFCPVKRKTKCSKSFRTAPGERVSQRYWKFHTADCIEFNSDVFYSQRSSRCRMTNNSFKLQSCLFWDMNSSAGCSRDSVREVHGFGCGLRPQSPISISAARCPVLQTVRDMPFPPSRQ